MPNNTAGSSFGQSLQFITEIKLQELEKQRLAYQTHAKVLQKAKILGDSGNLLKKVEVLAKAVKSWIGSGQLKGRSQIVGGKLQMKNLEYWIQQARYDPNFDRKIAEGWAETLEDHIRHITMRFDSAKLFGNLFNEWLASGDSVAQAYQAEPSENQSEFVEVGRKELYEQKEKLMSIVFDDYPIKVPELNAYLKELFGSEEATKALAVLRKDLKDFGVTLQRMTITHQDVRNAITGLLATGLMDEEKRTTLKAFEENPTVMNEVTSVLNMRMAGLDTWAWPKEGILVEFRRHFNGKYRAFTDPEIMDALLLHHLGVAWQVKLKSCLTRLFGSKAWIRPVLPENLEKKRLGDQLRDLQGRFQEPHSINVERENNRHTMFFMTQLQDKFDQPKAYDNSADPPQRNDSQKMSGAQIKQKLLHIVTTETYLNTALHGTHAIVCSDLEWFGPSLPHASILTVLEFLGISKTWLTFFQAFLSAPIRFQGENEARTRKRGTPIGYALSVFCGEAIIFIMDFAVNQRANGLFLHRMHDDLWLWDSSAKKVVTGWAEMNKCAQLVGLKFNVKKTGSAYVGPPEDALGLPAGDVRWGFLVFNPNESRFILDQEEINKNIVEMRRQLAKTKSVFGWVNTYNKYMSYILRNMGGIPANCFGKAHIDDIIGTLSRIQRELFDDGSGSAIGYLRKTIEERFGIADLPEGYFYFPIGSGGLELRNPVLELLTLQRHAKPLVSYGQQDDTDDDEHGYNPDDDNKGASSEVFLEHTAFAEQKFRQRIVHDQKLYPRLKNVWDKECIGKRGPTLPFMSYEEFASLRESWFIGWGSSYRDMLQLPKRFFVELVPNVKEALAQSTRSWDEMDWYEQWVVSMYGDEVVKRFGGLDAVDPNLIPVGMVLLFRTSRIKLDQ